MYLRTNCSKTYLFISPEIWIIPRDLCIFIFPIAVSTSKVLSSGTSGSVICTDVSLTLLTPCKFNSWEKWFLHPNKILWQFVTKSPFSSFAILGLGVYLSWNSLMPLYKPQIFLFSLLVSSSSIFAFKCSSFCSWNIYYLHVLYCLDYLDCFRLDLVNTIFLDCFLWSKNREHS